MKLSNTKYSRFIKKQTGKKIIMLAVMFMGIVVSQQPAAHAQFWKQVDKARKKVNNYVAPRVKIPKYTPPKITPPKFPTYKPPQFKRPNFPTYKPPQFKRPNVPRFNANNFLKKPSVPKFRAPSFPKYTPPKINRPTFPKFNPPKFNVPKFRAPSVPKFRTPSVPKFRAPSFPKYTPPKINVPKFRAPSIPKFRAPSVPKFRAPSFPKFTPPKFNPPKISRPSLPRFNPPSFSKPPVFKAPTISRPNLPVFKAPKVGGFSGLKVPSFKVPKGYKVPTIRRPRLPAIKVPNVGRLGGLKVPSIKVPKANGLNVNMKTINNLGRKLEVGIGKPLQDYRKHVNTIVGNNYKKKIAPGLDQMADSITRHVLGPNSKIKSPKPKKPVQTDNDAPLEEDLEQTIIYLPDPNPVLPPAPPTGNQNSTMNQVANLIEVIGNSIANIANNQDTAVVPVDDTPVVQDQSVPCDNCSNQVVTPVPNQTDVPVFADNANDSENNNQSNTELDNHSDTDLFVSNHSSDAVNVSLKTADTDWTEMALGQGEEMNLAGFKELTIRFDSAGRTRKFTLSGGTSYRFKLNNDGKLDLVSYDRDAYLEEVTQAASENNTQQTMLQNLTPKAVTIQVMLEQNKWQDATINSGYEVSLNSSKPTTIRVIMGGEMKQFNLNAGEKYGFKSGKDNSMQLVRLNSSNS